MDVCDKAVSDCAGCDVNLCEPYGNVTPLHLAVNIHNDISLFRPMLDLLLRGGCILNWRAFSTLETPLYRSLGLEKVHVYSQLCVCVCMCVKKTLPLVKACKSKNYRKTAHFMALALKRYQQFYVISCLCVCARVCEENTAVSKSL
jgi:hypothetical protein